MSATMVAALDAMPRGDVHRASYWLNSLSEDWRGEIPYRLHTPGYFGLGSAPPFAPEFIGYVGRLECKRPGCTECGRKDNGSSPRFKNDDTRLRTTRAFRRLRKIAPREFDACYLYCVLRWDIPGIAKAMTQRAIRLEKPERYDPVAITLLLMSGIDKVQKFW